MIPSPKTEKFSLSPRMEISKCLRTPATSPHYHRSFFYYEPAIIISEYFRYGFNFGLMKLYPRDRLERTVCPSPRGHQMLVGRSAVQR